MMVINLKHYKTLPPNSVYIGRANRWRRLPQSPFHNPFKLPPGATREERDEVLDKFRTYLLERPELVARAKAELKDKILVCWCAPEPCHGHVLLAVVNGEL